MALDSQSLQALLCSIDGCFSSPVNEKSIHRAEGLWNPDTATIWKFLNIVFVFRLVQGNTGIQGIQGVKGGEVLP